MATEITTEQLDAEQTHDIATAWKKAAHWSKVSSKGVTLHLLVVGRTIVQDYAAVDTERGIEVVHTASYLSDVGTSFKSAEMKARGWRRHKSHMMYNEITHELSLQ